jgi:hypothetical protein
MGKLQQLWNREDAKGAKIVAKKHGEYPLRVLCVFAVSTM